MPNLFRSSGCSRGAAVCALAFSLGAGQLMAQSTAAAPAQDTSKDQTSSSPRIGQGPVKNAAPEFRRWGIGGIFSYVPLNLMKGGTVKATANTLTSKAEGRPLGGGVAGYFYLTKTLSLNLDFIYRRSGYNASNVINDAFTTSYYSRTRANYYDFPLLARYHSGRYHLLRSPVFVEGGGTLRYVEQITTSTTVDTIVNSALVSTCCAEAPDRPRHREAAGVTAGAGLRLLPDEFGLRIVPEVRYTRWLQSTFSAAPTLSNRNQVEVLLSISF